MLDIERIYEVDRLDQQVVPPSTRSHRNDIETLKKRNKDLKEHAARILQKQEDRRLRML